MTDKRLFLHIGSRKTGSTAIQGYLKLNTEALADAAQAPANGFGSLRASV